MDMTTPTPTPTPTPTTTLDLHGRRSDDAVSDVTLFLERVRRTVDASPASSKGKDTSSGGGNNQLFVKIITGSGVHSSHGPILRSVVQKLLVKRGMNWTLERGGGAFQVDALSGFELYAPDIAVDSKVVVAEKEDFHQLAASLKSNSNKGYTGTNNSCAQSTSAQSTSDLPSSTDPLPSQVALEDDALRTAMQLSITECQQHQKQRVRLMEEYENDLSRAVSESDLLGQTQNYSAADEQFEESLKIACEESLVAEQQQREQNMSDEQFEDALRIALQESTKESTKSDEDDQMLQALAESKVSLMEYQDANHSEDELLQRAMEESAAEEERRNAYRREQEMLAMSQDAILIEEVKRLSLMQQKEKDVSGRSNVD